MNMKRFKDFISLNESKISFDEFEKRYGDDVRDIYWMQADMGLVKDDFTVDDAIETAYEEYLKESLDKG